MEVDSIWSFHAVVIQTPMELKNVEVLAQTALEVVVGECNTHRRKLPLFQALRHILILPTRWIH